MAGIGFELKKAFAKKGVLNLFKAYALSGVVVTGPMLLSILLLISLRILFQGTDHPSQEQLLINGLITYTTLFSVVFVNCFALVVIRYVADVIYAEKFSLVMPSFFGSVTFLIASGEVLYGAFLYCMRIPLRAAALAMLLFAIHVIVWMQINYLSAIKNYAGILLAFLGAVLCGIVSGWFLNAYVLHDAGYAVIVAVITTYGILAVGYHVLLGSFFPRGEGSPYAFFKYFGRYKELLITGICLQAGIYGHIVIMWFSPAGNVIAYGLRECAVYDLPAMIAFLSCIITVINITTSLEVNFYPYYYKYIHLLNHGGSLNELKKAESAMKRTLYDEIFYCLIKQFFVTLVFIVGGSMLLKSLGFSFTGEMLGIFRVLCVGYALYASGYALLLVLLYFSYRFVYVPLVLYALAAIGLSVFVSNGAPGLFGAGFVIAGLIFLTGTYIALSRHLKNLLLHIFVGQQMVQ